MYRQKYGQTDRTALLTRIRISRIRSYGDFMLIGISIDNPFLFLSFPNFLTRLLVDRINDTRGQN